MNFVNLLDDDDEGQVISQEIVDLIDWELILCKFDDLQLR